MTNASKNSAIKPPIIEDEEYMVGPGKPPRKHETLTPNKLLKMIWVRMLDSRKEIPHELWLRYASLAIDIWVIERRYNKRKNAARTMGSPTVSEVGENEPKERAARKNAIAQLVRELEQENKLEQFTSRIVGNQDDEEESD